MRRRIDKILHNAWYDVHRRVLRRPEPPTADTAPYCVHTLNAAGQFVVDDPYLAAVGVPPADAHVAWPVHANAVYRFPEVYVVGSCSYLYAPDCRQLLAGAAPVAASGGPLRRKDKVMRPVRPVARALPTHDAAGRALEYWHLSGSCMENRTHFLVEQVVRLHVMQQLPPTPDTDWRLLLPARYPAWLRDYLALLGVPADRLVAGTDGTLHVRRLVYTGFASGGRLCYPRAAFEAVGQRLAAGALALAGYDRPPVADAPPVWITRRGSYDNRELVNEDACIAAWEQRFGPIRVVRLHELSLAEQVRMCLTARCIVAQQGQALNLMSLCPRRPVVMFDHGRPSSRPTWNNVYLSLATFSGCSLVRFYDGAPIPGSPLPAPHNPWSFPLDRFDAQLAQFDALLRADRLGPVWSPLATSLRPSP